ncbi:unnamed protein product [Rotaria sp. Silwood1]|nr:unnamed protein product [Rotaria sp. Silwood1]
MQGVCADGPGQSKITEMISHNGYYGCRVCEFEGIYYYSDRTCTYPWSIYVQTNPPFRTRDRFESCLKEAEYLKNIGDKNINVFGIKGVSPLNRLLFVPTQAIYDYFYLCLEKMSMSTVSKNSASQRVVMASSTSATQYRSSSEYQSSSQHQSLSQHQSSSQHQPSNSHQSPSVRRSSNVRQLSSVHEPSYVRQPSDVYRPSSQATNYFGPIRSSIVQVQYLFTYQNNNI